MACKQAIYAHIPGFGGVTPSHLPYFDDLEAPRASKSRATWPSLAPRAARFKHALIVVAEEAAVLGAGHLAAGVLLGQVGVPAAPPQPPRAAVPRELAEAAEDRAAEPAC